MVGERGFEPPTPWSRTGSEKNLNSGKISGAKEVWNQRLGKSLLGADSKKLKMRRLPPTKTRDDETFIGSCHYTVERLFRGSTCLCWLSLPTIKLTGNGLTEISVGSIRKNKRSLENAASQLRAIVGVSMPAASVLCARSIILNAVKTFRRKLKELKCSKGHAIFLRKY